MLLNTPVRYTFIIMIYTVWAQKKQELLKDNVFYYYIWSKQVYGTTIAMSQDYDSYFSKEPTFF